MAVKFLLKAEKLQCQLCLFLLLSTSDLSLLQALQCCEYVLLLEHLSLSSVHLQVHRLYMEGVFRPYPLLLWNLLPYSAFPVQDFYNILLYGQDLLYSILQADCALHTFSYFQMHTVYSLRHLRHQRFLLYLSHFLSIFQQIYPLCHLHSVYILRGSALSKASEVLYSLPFFLFPSVFPMDPHLKI